MDISTESGFSRTMGPDMVFGNSLGLDVIVALVGIARSPRSYGPSGNLPPKHQHVPRWQTRPWAYAQPLVVKGAMDIDTDSG